MTLTMQTNLSEFKITCSSSVADITDKEAARDILGSICGALYLAPLCKKPEYKLKIKQLRKIRRMVLKVIDGLPDLTDQHGNVMTRHHCSDMDYYFNMCSSEGATKRFYNNGLCAVYAGPDIAITYCEGSVTMYRGSQAGLAANEATDFWIND
jgi:hypothetical protein